ncbi:MAG: hypothetical protein WKF66_17695 [Pedobacter sp.]
MIISNPFHSGLTKTILFVSLSLFTFLAKSQDKHGDSVLRTKTAISVSLQPFFLVNNTLKADLEIQPIGRKFNYVITAELYDGPMLDDDDFSYTSRFPEDQINGFGLGILQKYKFKNQLSSPYLAYGVTFRHQEVAIETEGFYSTEKDGLMYYDYGDIKKRLINDAILFSATLGYQKVSRNVVYDLYFGFGYKLPLNDTKFGGYRRYEQGITSIAYKGFGMLVGFKLGYQFQ